MKKNLLFCLMLFFLVLLIDQISKYCVIRYSLLPVYFNTTIAFSLPIAWYIPWLVIGVVLLTYFSRASSWNDTKQTLSNTFSIPLFRFALPLIAGGGISNILDRVFHNGSVVDFIDLRFWPVFNLADSAIVIGVFLIIYHLYTTKGASYGKS